MSCLCPISIPDKVARDYGIKGATIVVPCGHCVECARDRRNDWFVRIWSTYQRYAAMKLPVWFFTATIDQKLWPNMKISSDGVGDRVTLFVRSWNERFRYLNGGVMPLRFMCSEFGSNGKHYIDHNGVDRVTTGALHFHGVIFGRIPIKKLVYGLSQTHGHVDFDLIRGPQAIRYVVKYSTKDYSIEDPKLRARTFCSPGIGDSTYYFGDSEPTSTVLINGYHYRTPRYFFDKQWKRLYGRNNFFDASGRSVVVVANFKRRLSDYKYRCSYIDSLRQSDPSFRFFSYRRLLAGSKIPADLDTCRRLLSLGLIGPSHPLLRRHENDLSYVRFYDAMSSDRSFENRKPFNYLTQINLFYERHQTFLPLSFDIPT